MINSKRGGVIHLGILDDGTIEGLCLSIFQQDHIRLSIQVSEYLFRLNETSKTCLKSLFYVNNSTSFQAMFENYTPKVPSRLYHVVFKPVIDTEDELEEIEQFNSNALKMCPVKGRKSPHLIKSLQPCWCDSDANASFSHGWLNPFYVVEIWIEPWDLKDPRNEELFEVSF